MRIKLTRTNKKFEFTGSNESSYKISLDASKNIPRAPKLLSGGSGGGPGFRQMQLLLIGLAGCSAIDLLRDKFCPLYQILKETSTIEYSYEIH